MSLTVWEIGHHTWCAPEMKSPSTCTACLAAYIAIALSLWTASQWWEKGLAERSGDPIISPDGCYRLETFKPFWVLPNMFHRKPHPDEDVPPKWFPLWATLAFIGCLTIATVN
ncbi:Uncharacterized protein ALO41_01734 [Pseudomonas amygdali pv. ulmi]|uniref:Uncharacterized protein n=1 Tax=Pseudomonas amygdali pv. ulmi TaxID=251720 RepID=A0A0Q0JB53_PSEA0|nr:Uncharacterized protein ALO90_01481 [Pseudomonas amygdali pv. aesculi]KPZ11600.1 Uncharacterized protein ALO41_01734 [Pseudomonas amygdali pv. ulmi]RMR17241.1 hypothetical protein ALP90_101779 [Pseudomonas amygdali pv. ulmi]